MKAIPLLKLRRGLKDCKCFYICYSSLNLNSEEDWKMSLMIWFKLNGFLKLRRGLKEIKPSNPDKPKATLLKLRRGLKEVLAMASLKLMCLKLRRGLKENIFWFLCRWNLFLKLRRGLKECSLFNASHFRKLS